MFLMHLERSKHFLMRLNTDGEARGELVAFQMKKISFYNTLRVFSRPLLNLAQFHMFANCSKTIIIVYSPRRNQIIF